MSWFLHRIVVLRQSHNTLLHIVNVVRNWRAGVVVAAVDDSVTPRHGGDHHDRGGIHQWLRWNGIVVGIGIGIGIGLMVVLFLWLGPTGPATSHGKIS